jgi:hypothetical protein
MMRPGGNDLPQLYRLGFTDHREIRDLLHIRPSCQLSKGRSFPARYAETVPLTGDWLKTITARGQKRLRIAPAPGL